MIFEGRRVFEQFRAICFDRKENPDEEDSWERGIVVNSRSEAEDELAQMMSEANPPFDDGWISHRFLTDWERIDDPIH